MPTDPEWLAAARSRYMTEPAFRQLVDVMVQERLGVRDESDPAVVRAQASLVQLREDMDLVKITHPAYMPGSEPSAADACHHVLDMLDYGLRQLATYLQVAL